MPSKVTAQPSRAVRIGLLLSVGLLTVVTLALCRDCEFQGLWSEFQLRYRSWILDFLKSFLWTVLKEWPSLIVSPFLDPYLYVVLGVLLMMERLFPAQPQQARLSVGMVQDIFWFVMRSFLAAVIISVMMKGLHSLYQNYLSILSVHTIQSWSLAFKVTLVVVVNDFLDWFHHVVRHKVWVFWCFHAVHHSQREMNMFTDERVHLIDDVVANCLVCIPMFMFSVDAPMALYFALLLRWYPKLYHANIKADFGVLKYVLVTPQSHRIHHSIEPQHRDRNFGIIFSFWDWMFGTLYPHSDEYPATGIPDAEFPVEREVTGIRVMSNYVAQILYPFVLMYRQRTGMGVRTSHGAPL